MPFAIGVDLGATKIEAGLVDERGKAHKRHRVLTHAGAGIDAVQAGIFEAIAAVRPGEPVAGIGVGVAGAVDNRSGRVVHAPNARCLNDRNLVEIIAQGAREPVMVDNDGNTFALAEHRFGAARGMSSVVGLTLGTGVGGGLIMNGKLWRGADGVGAELGHMTLRYGGRMCGCGKLGHAEAYLSGTALEDCYLEYVRGAGIEPDPGMTVPRLFRAFHSGERAGRAVIEPFLEHLAAFIATLINVFNPEMVVLGGGIALQKVIWNNGVPRIAREVFASSARTNIVPAAGGESAGMLGAAALVLFEESATGISAKG